MSLRSGDIAPSLAQSQLSKIAVLKIADGSDLCPLGRCSASAPPGRGAHEWIVWEGPAADKAEALKCAEKADPRVDLEWMRIRYERDLIDR